MMGIRLLFDIQGAAARRVSWPLSPPLSSSLPHALGDFSRYRRISYSLFIRRAISLASLAALYASIGRHYILTDGSHHCWLEQHSAWIFSMPPRESFADIEPSLADASCYAASMSPSSHATAAVIQV